VFGIRVLSFDVFDTSVYRSLLDPEHLKLINTPPERLELSLCYPNLAIRRVYQEARR